MRYVTPGYFATLGIPISQGRDVSETDTAAGAAGGRRERVVRRALLARAEPDRPALPLRPAGRRDDHGVIGAFQDRTVVGVVGDVKVRGLERRSEPQAYLPYRQQPEDAMGFYTPQDLAVRHTGDPRASCPALRRIVAPRRPGSSRSPTSARSRRSSRRQTAPRRVQVRVLAGFRGARGAARGHRHPRPARLHRGEPVARDRRAPRARRPDAPTSSAWCCGTACGSPRWASALGLVLAYAAGRSLEALLAGVSPRDVGHLRRRRRASRSRRRSPAACCRPGGRRGSTR